MEVEWDPAKRKSNLAKHSLDFADVDLLFEGPVIARKDSRKDYGEERWQGVGVLVISLRRASERERQAYWAAVENRLGEGRFD